MRSLRQISAIALVSLLASCSGTGFSPTEVGELFNAEQRWARVGPTSYLIDHFQQCFCRAVEGWATLRVEGDSIVSVTTEDGAEVPRDQWGERTTVAGSFTKLRSLLNDGWGEVALQFDERTGFPTRTLFTPSGNTLDGTTGFSFRNLRPRLRAAARQQE